MADVNDSTSFFSMEPTIEEYNPNWPVLYQNALNELTALFGEHLVAAHHMGSTSVPGMKAKPIIDIKIATNLLPLPEATLDGLSQLQYKHRVTPSVPSDVYMRFDREVDGKVVACLHCVPGDTTDSFYQGTIIMKNFLMRHEDMRKKYSDVKTSLVQPGKKITMLEYRSGKQEVLGEIFSAAQTWWSSLSEEELKEMVH